MTSSQNSEIAVEALTRWKSSAITRQKFSNVGDYVAYLENPKNLVSIIIDDAIEQHEKSVSASTALKMNKAWRDHADLRAEFKNFNIFSAYVENSIKGNIKMLARH